MVLETLGDKKSKITEKLEKKYQIFKFNELISRTVQNN